MSGQSWANERRDFPRYTCNFEARLESPHFECSCRILDLSASGARVTIDPIFSHNNSMDSIVLRIADLGSFSASRKWGRGAEIGLAFTVSSTRKQSLNTKLRALGQEASGVKLLDG